MPRASVNREAFGIGFVHEPVRAIMGQLLKHLEVRHCASSFLGCGNDRVALSERVYLPLSFRTPLPLLFAAHRTSCPFGQRLASRFPKQEAADSADFAVSLVAEGCSTRRSRQLRRECERQAGAIGDDLTHVSDLLSTKPD